MVDVIFGVVAKLRDAPLSRSRGIALAMSSASRAALVSYVLQPFIFVIFVVVAKLLVEALSRRLRLRRRGRCDLWCGGQAS